MLKIEFHVNETFTATVRKARKLEIDIKRLPPESRTYVFEYGLQRVINDSVGAVKRDDYTGEDAEAKWLDACLETAAKKLDGLYAGEFTLRQRATRDEVAIEMRAIAVATLRNAGKLPSGKDEAVKALEAFMEKNDAKLRAKAEAVIAERKANADEFDL